MTSAVGNGQYLLIKLSLHARLVKIMSVMVASIVQVLHPFRRSPERRRIRHVVDQAPQQQPPPSRRREDNTSSMDEFAAEIKTLFERDLQYERLLDISGRLQAEYRTSLRSSNISMLPSYQHTLPTGRERGDVLALDVGGSTCRIALIRLGGKRYDGDGLQVRRVRSFAIDENIRQLDGDEFFDWIAARIGEMLAEYNYMTGTTDAHLRMGLAWSFPIDQTSPRSGRLLAMGKGFYAARDLEGKDLGELLTKACHKRGLNVDLCALVNDGGATLLSQAYRDPTTRISLILGTGVNAAVFIPVKALGPEKFGERPDSWYEAAERVIVNTEMSMFGKSVLPTTRWDNQLNAQHHLPDFQPLEYLVTGRYLGEIVRLIMLEAIASAGLFDGQIPQRLDEPYAFETRILATFESDLSTDLAEARAVFQAAHPLCSPPQTHELEFIQNAARLVSRRAAAYLATALHALWAVRTSAEGLLPGEASHVTIACDGSMVEKYPGFRNLAQIHLDRLCVLSGASEGAVTLEVAPESSIFGAAVAVSCNDS